MDTLDFMDGYLLVEVDVIVSVLQIWDYIFPHEILQKFCYRILFPFLLLHITKNNFLPHLIKKESYSLPHCIFQSFFALNRGSI